MKAKSKLDMLRQAATVAGEATAMSNEQLAEVVRLSGSILTAANDELRHRHSEAETKSRQEWEARRKQMKAKAEAAERARIRDVAEAAESAAARQAKSDDEEAEQARCAMQAIGLKPVAVFSHPRSAH